MVDKEDFDTVIDSEMSNVMADSNASGRKCISRASEKRLVQTFSDILVRWKIIMGASSGQSLDLGSLLSEGVSVENDFTAESKASLTHLSQAFLLVNQVTKLRLWKLNLVNQGLLSTLELARRAGDIERELKAIEDYSRTLEHSGSRVTPCWAGFRSTSKVASSHACDWHTLLSILRSRLFAVAGKIYLHIVVSGPNFNLPEIRANVEVGMSDIYRLKALAEDQLISIAWPLCVIGCMVSPELMTKGRTPMREWLSEILRNTAETHFYLGDVLKVAEKCWEALDSGSNTDDCVWMGEVNKVNCNTVLI